MAEVTKAAQDREITLADIKRRRDEYQASKAATVTQETKAAPTATKATFNF